MPMIVSIDDIKPTQVVTYKEETGGPPLTNAIFIGPDPRRSREGGPVASHCPSAFLSRFHPGRFSSPHYHVADEFQLIVDGKGKIGRNEVFPYSVQFVRAYTLYGPLVADKETETGLAFLVLRTRYDQGSQHTIEARNKLKLMPGRSPQQIHEQITFAIECADINLQAIPGFKDDRGLFAYSFTMAPGTQTTAPEPSGGDGQFIVVIKGSLMHDGVENNALAVVFIRPEEEAFQIRAGRQGLQGCILNMPQVKPHASGSAKMPSVSAGYKKWQCVMCAFAYDEALGIPHDGIPPGTRWENIPDSWNCPDCSAAKNEFQLLEL